MKNEFLMKCKNPKCENQATTKPYEKGLYCSPKCVLAVVRTREHQIKAGKAGAKVNIDRYRGTGTKSYVKELGRHQHRVVMEKKLGRKLRKGEVIHHIDNNKKNNDLKNLQVMTQSQHIKLHLKQNGGTL